MCTFVCAINLVFVWISYNPSPLSAYILTIMLGFSIVDLCSLYVSEF